MRYKRSLLGELVPRLNNINNGVVNALQFRFKYFLIENMLYLDIHASTNQMVDINKFLTHVRDQTKQKKNVMLSYLK